MVCVCVYAKKENLQENLEVLGVKTRRSSGGAQEESKRMSGGVQVECRRSSGGVDLYSTFDNLYQSDDVITSSRS